MDNLKFEKFCNSAIEKTKSGVFTWERLDSGIGRNYPKFDCFRSFICTFSGGRIILGADRETGDTQCLISPEKSLPFQRIVTTTEPEEACLLRLYNLVYSSFPSVDSFLDAVINSPNEKEELPF